MAQSKSQKEWVGRHVLFTVTLTPEEKILVDKARVECERQQLIPWVNEKGINKGHCPFTKFVRLAVLSTARSILGETHE